MTNFFLIITILGSWKTILFLNILILIKLKLSKTNLLIITSSLSNLFVVEPLKYIFKEIRPVNVYESSYSFPSGHSYSAITFYGLITYLLYKKYKLKSIPIIGTMFILFIAYSRIYLGVHYLHDVLAGLLLGLIWLYFLQKTFGDKIQNKNTSNASKNT